MRQEERFEDREEALRIMLEGFQGGIWTAMPAVVNSFDAATQTCEVTIAIMGTETDAEGNVTYVDMGQCPLVNVPVYRLRGGGFSITTPLVKDDEGLVILASRCIDTWWQNGGTNNVPYEQRLHDLSDGFFLPGFNSQTKNLTAYSTTSVQIRDDAGDTYIEVKNGQLVNIVAPNGCNINGVTIDTDGNITLPAGATITGGGAQAVRLADGSLSTKLKGT